MSTGPRHPGDREALTPEERALADRIARLGPQGEPSPALDARILAAARAAAAAPAPRSTSQATWRRNHRRWPVALGTAATLVVVGGLAWQLRPVDEIHVAYSEAPRAMSGPSADAPPAPREARRAPAGAPATASAESAPTEAESAASAAEPPVARAVQPAPPPPAPADERADMQMVDEPPAPKAFPAPVPAPEEPPIVFDEPSPMDTPSPPPLRQQAPPPAPPAPAAPAPAVPSPMVAPPQATDSAATPAARKAVEAKRKAAALQAGEAAATQRAKVATGTSAQPARPASAAAAADASSLDRIEVTGSRIESFDAASAVDQPLDDQPPASADSPQVRQAWLHRVRELLAEGKPDAARDSLREYQRRYPQAELPEDLRALLAQ